MVEKKIKEVAILFLWDECLFPEYVSIKHKQFNIIQYYFMKAQIKIRQ